MFELDVERMKILASMMGEIPCDQGRNFIRVTFYPGFQAGYFTFQFSWKCNNGEREFRSLDEAIAILQKLIDVAGPSQYTD
jgi:hypothetical protein